MNDSDRADTQASRFQVGIFGDTGSGKTVYLTAWQWAAEHNLLPSHVENIRPANNHTARYLGERVAMIRAGKWPPGTVDTTDWVVLLLDLPQQILEVKTRDFRGGDFGRAFYHGDRRDAEGFVNDLFSRCSAYLFLVDPGRVRDAQTRDTDDEAQQRREAETLGVVPALEVVRRKSWGFRFFHHPVALVFTKCDRYPGVAEDPEAFARKYMPQTYRYLRRHARRQHAFFAVSSTGTVPDQNRPPEELEPSGIFSPILWCAHQHKKRLRFMKALAVVVALVLVGVGYSLLYLNHGRAIEQAREEAAGGNTDQIYSVYRRVEEWQGLDLFILTHMWERRRCLQDVVEVANEGFERTELSNRKDDKGNLRTVDDYVAVQKAARQFVERYAGEKCAKDLSGWLQSQRERLAARVVDKAMEAAREGNQGEFDMLEGEYEKVAMPRQDRRWRKAKRILIETIIGKDVYRLFQTRDYFPRNLEGVLEKCNLAEKAFEEHPGADLPKYQEYVESVRKLYDQLRRNGLTRYLRLKRVVSESSNPVRWRIIVGAGDRDEPPWSSWHGPIKLNENQYRTVCNAYFNVDILSERAVYVNVEEDTWFRNGMARNTVQVRELLEKASVEVVTNEDTAYTFEFDCSQVRPGLELLGRVEELENELFR